MRKITFKNEYFLCEKDDKGRIFTTILKYKDNCLGICLDGCVLGTDENGFIKDEFTPAAMAAIKDHCFNNQEINERSVMLELRCRALNGLL